MFSEFLFVTLMTIFVKNSVAITDEQKAYIQKEFITVGVECMVSHPLTAEDIVLYKDKKFPESENAPCFTECVMKELGLMNEDGKYAYDKAIEKTKDAFSEEDHKKFIELLGKCDKVNDEEVSDDGDKGCKRAKLVYNCLIEIAPEYGFDVNI